MNQQFSPLEKIAPAPMINTGEQQPAAAFLQSQGGFETLFLSTQTAIQADAPVAQESVVLLKEIYSGSLYAQCTMQSISDDPISAILLDVNCEDVWGNKLQGVVDHQILDIKAKRGELFGQTEQILLPEKETRKISVSLKKVMFSNGTVKDIEDTVELFDERETLPDHFGSIALAEEYVRKTVPSAKYVPVSAGTHWRCTCGSINAEAEQACAVCGSNYSELTALLEDPSLNDRLQAYQAE